VGGESSNSILTMLREFRKTLSDAFLPVGFPHSVSDDYLAYQAFDSLQAFFSTISSLLANRALLKGLGVGDANSSATHALLLTILKDAMSRIATIIFAHRFGLTIEPECKKYRFLADIFNDSAFFLDLFSPYLGSWGKILALTTGEALRALCGVAAGASKAALSSHFAKQDNLAELNAKEASQETAVGLFGLLVGTLVVKCVEDSETVFWLMVLLVFGHLWMNYLGVRSVKLHTLNRQRASILFSEYLKTGSILSPSQVATRESIVLWRPVVRNQHGDVVASIHFAKSYRDALKRYSGSTGIIILENPAFKLFIPENIDGRTAIQIMLHDGAVGSHAITAWFMAMEIAWLIDSKQGFGRELKHMFSSRSEAIADRTGKKPNSVDIYQERYSQSDLMQKLEAVGWDTRNASFETGAPIRLRVSVHDETKKER
jgi:hypothetical protein